jgi:hypothetical protein
MGLFCFGAYTQKTVYLKSPLFLETVSQVRLWFDKFTMHGLRHFKNQLVSCVP